MLEKPVTEVETTFKIISFYFCLTFTLYGNLRYSSLVILLNIAADNTMSFLLAEMFLGVFSNIFLARLMFASERSAFRLTEFFFFFYSGSFHMSDIFNNLLSCLFTSWCIIKLLPKCCWSYYYHYY